MLFLRTFGGLSLENGGRPITGAAAQRGRLAILAVLATANGTGVSRDRLFALFWPDSDIERARGALKQALYAVRRDVAEQELTLGTSELRLNPNVITSDVAAFEGALAAGDLDGAVSRYAGPFLDGIYLKDAPEFERWVDGQRDRLARGYAGAIEGLARAAAERGDATAAVTWTRRLAIADPLSSRIARRLMDALVDAGDPEGAIRHADAHAALLRSELGSDPEQSLLDFAASLRTTRRRSAAVHAHDTFVQQVAVDDVPLMERPPEPLAPPENRRVAWNRAVKTRWAIAAAIVMLAVGTVASRRLIEPNRANLDQSKVLVVAFTNRTRDSTLDAVGAMTADWITRGLSETGIVQVVEGPTALHDSRAAASDSAGFDAVRLLPLADRAGAGTIVSGAYYLERDSIVFEARITDARDGTVLRTVAPITASRADSRPAMQLLRERTAGALATIVDPRLASFSDRSSRPPLTEAYRLYLQGLDQFGRNEPGEAMKVFLAAAREDSTFLLPVVWADYSALYMGRLETADSLLAVLELHRAQLASVERAAVDFFRLGRASAPKSERLVAARRVAALVPASHWSYTQANLANSVGYTAEALAALQRIDPEHGWVRNWRPFHTLLFNVEHEVGDYQAELDAVRRFARSDPTFGNYYEIRALIALGRVDSATARMREFALSGSEARSVALMTFAGVELRAHGHHVASDSLFRLSLAWYHSPAARTDPWYLVSYARCAIEAGALDDAQFAAAKIVDGPALSANLVTKQAAHAILGMVAANRGDRPRAEAAMRMLDSLKPPGRPSFPGNYAPALQAQIAGFLRDRALTLRYLAELESGTSDLVSASELTHQSRGLRWLDNDPILRRPYIVGPP